MKLYTVQEAAKRLGMREGTIRAWILRGKISSVTVSGRSIRITEDEITGSSTEAQFLSVGVDHQRI